MRELIKSLSTLVFYVLIIIVLIYVIAAAASTKSIGMRRTIIPFLFVSYIMDYHRALGGFNLIDIARLFAFFMFAGLLFNLPTNGLAPKIFQMPPIAQDVDTAITKLAKLEEGDVIVKQIAPTKLTIWLSARATLPWTWFHDNELVIEPASGIDVHRWEFYPKLKTVLAHFVIGESIKRAEIWVENGGKLSRIHSEHNGSVVYAAGDGATLDDCSVLKVGWAMSVDHVDGRIDEANRWDFGNVNPRVVAIIPVNQREDETAIQHLPIFQDALLKDSNRPGRELFRATPQIKKYIKNLMLQNGSTNGVHHVSQDFPEE